MPTGTGITVIRRPPSIKAAANAVAKFERRAAKALAEAKAAEQDGIATRCNRARRKAEYLMRMVGRSLSGKMVAVSKTYEKPQFIKRAPADQNFINFAASISLTRPGTENIKVKAVDKKKWPEFRTLFAFGPYETARQTLASMCLKPLLPVQPNQFFTQNGGRPAAIRRVLDHIRNPNLKFVATLDLKEFFPSISQDWLKANLPIGAKVSAHTLCVDNHCDRARVTGHGLYRHALYEGSVLTASRRGIPQGAVSSPMIADAIICKVLRAIHAASSLPEGVEIVNYADDFAVFARSRKEMEAAVNTLQGAFGRRRDGDMRLVSDGIMRLSDGMEFLGYQISRRKGKVEIAPIRENIAKFAKHFDRLVGRAIVGDNVDYKNILSAVKAWRAAFREWMAGDFFILSRLRAYDRALPDAREALHAVYNKLVARHRRDLSALTSV